jgi:hypothetical protein
MEFLLALSLVLEGILMLIVCKCIIFGFVLVNFYISTCVVGKHMVLILCLNDFMNFFVELLSNKDYLVFWLALLAIPHTSITSLYIFY